MNAQELAEKFTAKIAVAAVEKDRQTGIAADNAGKRTADIEHCKKAMEQNVIPFLEELKHHLGEQQFSFAPQIEMNDRPHRRRGEFSRAVRRGRKGARDTRRRKLAGTAGEVRAQGGLIPVSSLNFPFREIEGPGPSPHVVLWTKPARTRSFSKPLRKLNTLGRSVLGNSYS